MEKPVRYFVSLLASIGIFFLANVIDGRVHDHCDDCFALIGFPFPYYNAGGFAGGGGPIWAGIVGDVVFVLAVTIGIAWLLSWTSRRQPVGE